MPIINKTAVLNPFYETTAKEYSDRLAAIDAHVASTLATQKSEVAAAIAQVNLTQSQTITALTLEVSNLKTNLTDSITATQTDLINKADQLRTELTDIAQQLTQDSAAITQEIQDALDYLKDDASVASALRTPRKIQGVDFDGTKDINLPTFTTQTDGLVPKRVGATTTNYLCEDGTWAAPPDTTYDLLTTTSAEAGTATSANSISAKVLKDAILYHTPVVTSIVGNAGTATKLQTPRTINGVLFDGTQNISLPGAVAYSLPTASDSVLGGIKVGSGLDISNSVLSVGTLNQSTTGNAATATKLQTARTISLTGKVTGSTSFDGSANVSLTTSITGLGAANGIATLDSNGRVPSTQLPPFAHDKIEIYMSTNVPTTSAGWQKIQLNSVSYDTNALFDSTNEYIKPKKAGYYMCNARVRFINTMSDIALGLGKNGENYAAIGPDAVANSVYAIGGSVTVYCNGTTDYIDLRLYSNSVQDFTVGAFDTYLGVIGPF